MKVIFKFPLQHLGRQRVAITADHEILKVGDQAGTITIWAQCETNSASRSIDVLVWPTGQELPSDINSFTYRDTVILHGGSSVWHVFTRAL